jgi:hypothetical protein
VMVARERDQGGVALHSTTLGYGVVPAVLAELTRRRHHSVPQHVAHVVNLVLARLTGVALWRKCDTLGVERVRLRYAWVSLVPGIGGIGVCRVWRKGDIGWRL